MSISRCRSMKSSCPVAKTVHFEEHRVIFGLEKQCDPDFRRAKWRIVNKISVGRSSTFSPAAHTAQRIGNRKASGMEDNQELGKQRQFHSDPQHEKSEFVLSIGKPVRRIFRCTGDRCPDGFGLDDVFVQLALRAALLKPSSIRFELCSLRAMIRIMFRNRDIEEQCARTPSPCECAPAETPLPDSLTEHSWSSWEAFSSRLLETDFNELNALGQLEFEKLSQHDPVTGQLHLDKSHARHLAGATGALPKRNPRRSRSMEWEPIDDSTFMLLENEIDSTPVNGLLSLNKGGMADIKGLTRLLARTVWLTGMRRSEVFRCRLFKIGSAGSCPDELRAFALRDPGAALRNKELSELTHEDLAPVCEWHPDGAVPVLAIPTLKTRNSSPMIDNSVRAFLLQGLSYLDLELLWLAARLQKLGLSGDRISLIGGKCSERLGNASAAVLPNRRAKVTLHTLRHAFADAARRSMPPAEAAALTGHTSIRTLRGYGARNLRWRQGSAAERWLPRPDPALASSIVEAWRLQRPDLEKLFSVDVPSPERL